MVTRWTVHRNSIALKLSYHDYDVRYSREATAKNVKYLLLKACLMCKAACKDTNSSAPHNDQLHQSVNWCEIQFTWIHLFIVLILEPSLNFSQQWNFSQIEINNLGMYQGAYQQETRHHKTHEGLVIPLSDAVVEPLPSRDYATVKTHNLETS